MNLCDFEFRLSVNLSDISLKVMVKIYYYSIFHEKCSSLINIFYFFTNTVLSRYTEVGCSEQFCRALGRPL